MRVLRSARLKNAANANGSDSPPVRPDHNNRQNVPNDSSTASNEINTNRAMLRVTHTEGSVNDSPSPCPTDSQCLDRARILESTKQLYSSLKNEIQLEYRMLAKETQCYLQNQNDNRNSNELCTIDIILLNADLEKSRHTTMLLRRELDKFVTDDTLTGDEEPEKRRKFELAMDLIESMELRLEFVRNERKKLNRKCIDMRTQISRRSDTNSSETVHNRTMPCRSSSTNIDDRNSTFNGNEMENVHSQSLPCQSSTPNINNKRPSTDRNPTAAKKSKVVDNQVVKSEPLEIETIIVNDEPTECPDQEEQSDPFLHIENPGFVGLRRLGRTCYMNSVVQCLNSVSLLKKFFADHLYFDDGSASILNGREAKVTRELARVMKALSESESRAISPRDLKTVIGHSKRQFDNLDQQDAHGFLVFLLETMHEELSEESNTQPNKSWSEAKIAWHESLKNRRSIISDFFFGQTRSSVMCARCLNVTTTYEVFKTLTVPLPKFPTAMHACLQKHLENHKPLRWKCPRCKVRRIGTAMIEFMRLPPVFIVHIGRFTEKDGWQEKKTLPIGAHLKKTTLNRFHVPNSDVAVVPHREYALRAIVRHSGVENGGAYVAVCKHDSPDTWVRYSNELVEKCTPAYANGVNSGNYIVLYEAESPSDKYVTNMR